MSYLILPLDLIACVGYAAVLTLIMSTLTMAGSWKVAQMYHVTCIASGASMDRIRSVMSSASGLTERSVTSLEYLALELPSNITTQKELEVPPDKADNISMLNMNKIEAKRIYELEHTLMRARIAAKREWDEVKQWKGELIYELKYETLKEIRDAEKFVKELHSELVQNSLMDYDSVN